jgi:uncharacterized protein YbjT (DUF2867 family)
LINENHTAMKYVITGSLGHVSKPLAEKLVAAGHSVTVVSSHAEKTVAIAALGARAAIGSVEDVDFLTRTFKCTDAVYTMVPPNFGATNWKQYISGIGENHATAIRNSGVTHVINLSSIGAHMPDGCGPVSGLFFVEKALNNLDGVDVLHLRPGFFYTNFLSSIGMIKTTGVIGGNYGKGTKLVLAHPADIADTAAEAMQNLSFRGKSIRYIASDEKTTDEIAAILGQAIGKPDLQWVDQSDEEALSGMLQNGISGEIARNYTEMGAAMRKGLMAAEYNANHPAIVGKIRFETFASQFATAYAQS